MLRGWIVAYEMADEVLGHPVVRYHTAEAESGRQAVDAVRRKFDLAEDTRIYVAGEPETATVERTRLAKGEIR